MTERIRAEQADALERENEGLRAALEREQGVSHSQACYGVEQRTRVLELTEALLNAIDGATEESGRYRRCIVCDHEWHTDEREQMHGEKCPIVAAQKVLGR